MSSIFDQVAELHQHPQQIARFLAGGYSPLGVGAAMYDLASSYAAANPPPAAPPPAPAAPPPAAPARPSIFTDADFQVPRGSVPESLLAYNPDGGFTQYVNNPEAVKMDPRFKWEGRQTAPHTYTNEPPNFHGGIYQDKDGTWTNRPLFPPAQKRATPTKSKPVAAVDQFGPLFGA